VIVADVGQQDVLAEKLNQQREPVLGVLTAGMMLPLLFPEPPGDIVEP
jgi:hypothetical protein